VKGQWIVLRCCRLTNAGGSASQPSGSEESVLDVSVKDPTPPPTPKSIPKKRRRGMKRDVKKAVT